MALFHQLLLPAALCVLATNGFQIKLRENRSSDIWKLGSVIKSEEIDFDFDVGQGGVRLAMESAIKIAGNVKHKPGNAEPKVSDLLRYTSVTELEEKYVQEHLKSSGGNVVCTGIGKEFYKDPGETVEKKVVLAPHDAVRDALQAAGATNQAEKVVINFLGGDDLQVLEVLDAVKELVLMLDVNTKCKIRFNSLCHSSLPKESVTLTVVSLPLENAVEDFRARQKAIALGEIYFRDGKWYTVIEEDINTAVA